MELHDSNNPLIEKSENDERFPVESILTLYKDYTKFGGRSSAMYNLASQLKESGYTHYETYLIVTNYANTLPQTDSQGYFDSITPVDISSAVCGVFK